MPPNLVKLQTQAPSVLDLWHWSLYMYLSIYIWWCLTKTQSQRIALSCSIQSRIWDTFGSGSEQKYVSGKIWHLSIHIILFIHIFVWPPKSMQHRIDLTWLSLRCYVSINSRPILKQRYEILGYDRDAAYSQWEVSLPSRRPISNQRKPSNYSLN